LISFEKGINSGFFWRRARLGFGIITAKIGYQNQSLKENYETHQQKSGWKINQRVSFAFLASFFISQIADKNPELNLIF